MLYRIIVFLILNFGALALGGLFTSSGVNSDWYDTLAKAPWTPPGWVFGFAWTTIMICFSIYLAYLWPRVQNKNILAAIYTLQWLLNVAWNPCFFYLHQVTLSLIVIIGLTLIVAYFLFAYASKLKWISLLILPCFIWLLIATSLNAFIYLNS